MKKSFLSVIAFTAVAVGPALAADLPRKAPAYVPPAPPVYNWTGFYGGINGGYSWGQARGDIDAPFLSGLGFPGLGLIDTRVSSGNLKPKGGIFGGQLGYNWQTNPSWVWGIETDLQWSGQKAHRNGGGTSSSTGALACPDPDVDADCDAGTYSQTTNVASSLEAKILWFGTTRLRAGFLINPTTLVYATGGVAYGGTKISGTVAGNTTVTCLTGECEGGFAGSAAGTFSRSRTNVGWTVGAGIEGAAFWAPSWTWKLEYLYMDLGTDNPNVPGFFTGNNVRFTDNIVRVGLNYKFNWGKAPPY